jgi:UDP-glucose 4-epimerase
MSYVLVLGASGFIGHHLIKRLLADGNNVIGYSRQVTEQFSECGNYVQIIGDFSSEVDFDIFFQKYPISCIYHGISTTVPHEGTEHIVREGQENIIPTLRLLESASHHKGMKLIFMSSGGTVYGENRGRPSKIGDEDTPICTYGIQKRTIEAYIEYYTRCTGLQGIIARLSNPYGVINTMGRTQGIIPIFLNNLRNGRGIVLFGDTVRDYIYIDDAIDALVMLKDYQGSKHIFNIGSSEGVRLSDLVTLLEQATGKQFVSVDKKPIRSCDVHVNVLDIEDTIRTLGWTPRIPLKAGIDLVWKAIN